MIGRLYSASIGNQAQTTAKTLVEISAAADLIVTLERMWISQSDFDTSENLGAKVEDITTTGTGTTFTAPLPFPLVTSDVPSTAVVKTDFTIEPTYSGGIYITQGFNVLSGWLWTPANDDEVIVISPSQLAGIRLDVAPSGSMNFSYGLIYREIGG
jgi:hypothetical protein